METKHVPAIAERQIGAQYLTDRLKCVRFVMMVYHESGLSTDFSFQPIICTFEQLVDPNNVGKIIFLMRKEKKSHLFNHVAIIYDINSVIHYSRYCTNDGSRKVSINTFDELLAVYDLVPNPYVKTSG
jgi:hypothetical protein